MKTRSHKYVALFACGLLLMEVAAARLLWIRHEQRQHAFALQLQKQAQQRQKTAQVQAIRLAALRDSIKTQNHLREKETLNSALSEAAAKGQLDRARQLIKRGANINREYGEVIEESPLFLAIKTHHLKMVCFLLTHGALCDFKVDGEYPLIYAARQGDNAIVKVLLTHGAEVDASMKLGTALVFAAEEGHLDVVRTLVQAGAQINIEYYDGTLLYHAVGSGNKAVIAYLLEHGANVNIINRGKCTHSGTPLTAAAETGDLEMLRLLLRYGADVNHCAKFDGSALTIAVARGHRNAVALLLRHGAKVKVVGSLEEYHKLDHDIKFFEERRVYDARTFTKDTKILRLLNHYHRRVRY